MIQNLDFSEGMIIQIVAGRKSYLLKRYLSVGAIVEFQHCENECFVKTPNKPDLGSW